jgi:hypothetical protein
VPQTSGTLTATIANGAQLSGAIDLKKCTAAGIFMPAAFTGVALTFFTAPTLSGTYVEIVKLDGTALSQTAAASKYIPLDPAYFAGVRFLKIRSGSAEGGARDLTVVTKV